MKTCKAIQAIGRAAVDGGLCDAILLKGSIGRGDDDPYSDVDLYLVVSPENREAVLQKRREYLSAYGEMVYLRDVDFGLPQKIAIYTDALHVDLYVAAKEQIGQADPIRVWYDPKGLFQEHVCCRADVTEEKIAETFSDALYCFVEADAAYRRKNDPWTARILGQAVAETAVLLRYLHDRPYAFLGLKKINEILPPEQYRLLEDASANLNGRGFSRANRLLIRGLELFAAQAGPSLREKLNLRMLAWVKESLRTLLFPAVR